MCPPLYGGVNCSVCLDTLVSICDTRENRSYLHMTFWLFFKEGKQVLGHSIFELPHVNDSDRYSRFKLMPSKGAHLNDSCSFINRRSDFCARCKHGYGPSVFTYYGIPCTKCNHNHPGWLYYILLELGFPTLMFVCFLVFRIRITSGLTFAFVFYCQAITNTFSMPFYYHLLTEYSYRLTNTVLTLYGIWNMDFFRLIMPRFCVSEQISTLGVVALGYISAFYLLLLTATVYTLMKLHQNGCKMLVAIWTPLHRYAIMCKRFLTFKISLVDIFASCLLLSHSKILFVSLQLILPLHFYTPKTSYRIDTIISIDPHIKYMHRHHLVYAIPATLILFIFGLLPLILCFYPSRCTRRMFSRCRLTASEDFTKLVSAFQGSYRNGESGSHDYRAVSSIYFFFRLMLNTTIISSNSHDFLYIFPFTLGAVSFIAIFAFFAYARPYKSNVHNIVELLLLSLLILQSILNLLLYDRCAVESKDLGTCGNQLHHLLLFQFCVLCIPQCVLIIYVLVHIAKRVSLAVSRHCHTRHQRLNAARLRDYSSLSLDNT